MTDGFEGFDEDRERDASNAEAIKMINLKLKYIKESCDEFKVFVRDFDKIFDAKYEAKQEVCPGNVWCKDGVKDFYELRTDYGKHIREHETRDELDSNVLINRKWLIYLLVVIVVGFSGVLVKLFSRNLK